MDVISTLQQTIEDELQRFSEPSDPEELYSPIAYALSSGGKRLRPLLVLLGCRIFSEDVSAAVHPAIGIEVFHNFTLLHDDIMDQAPLRRGKPTVHEKWDMNTAILSGDTMLAKAFQEVGQTKSEVLSEVLAIFCRTNVQVCEGQQLDMNYENRQNVSITEYLEMIRLKTAVLLGASLKIGAVIGGADAAMAELLYSFGVNIGLAFQLQDDILDVYGQSNKFGKQKGGDIISNKKTFLLLSAMELIRGDEADMLQTWLGNNDAAEKVKAVIGIYDRLNIRKLAEDRMWQFYRSAVSDLDRILGNADGIDRLRNFSHQLMLREK